jgi:hypothetical protein
LTWGEAGVTAGPLSGPFSSEQTALTLQLTHLPKPQAEILVLYPRQGSLSQRGNWTVGQVSPPVSFIIVCQGSWARKHLKENRKGGKNPITENKRDLLALEKSFLFLSRGTWKSP